MTSSPRTNALLQGTFYFRLSTEKVREGGGFYGEAIRLDPRYALRLCEFIERMATAGGWLAGWS